MSFLNHALPRLKSNKRVSSLVQRVPPGLKARMRRTVDRATRPAVLDRILTETSQTNDLLARMMYEEGLMKPRYQEPQRLVRHGFKVYSQHDEDGIIEEIFRRIGSTGKFFVEFGVGDGLENCTTYCLLKDWSGAWIDGSADCFEGIQRNLRSVIENGRLRTKYSFITAENIEPLFTELKVPAEFDFLSIDIDRNDYWVWRAIKKYRPRVVAIEYNATFKQTAACVIPYSATAIWDRTNYSGCSLKALEYLGAEKGYRLVGCNYTGGTSFFVREDLIGDRFAPPYTSENHYEPPRYFIRMPNGHPSNFGPLALVDPPRTAAAYA